MWGCGTYQLGLSTWRGVDKVTWLAESVWKALAQRVTLPYAKIRHLPVGIPSSSEPVKFAVNLAGPPAKPKYSLMTDSGLVP